jgi:hypothetical protein
VGHGGGTPGYRTISFHTLDGTRQVTVDWTDWGTDADASPAALALMTAALCPSYPLGLHHPHDPPPHPTEPPYRGRPQLPLPQPPDDPSDCRSIRRPSTFNRTANPISTQLHGLVT